MRSILFINRVYPPVPGATGSLLAVLASALVREGWEVYVVTSCSDPALARSEIVDGVHVERVRGLPFTKASHWKRALSYLSLYPALFWRAWRLPRMDVITTITDPPLQLVLGPILAFLKGGRLIHWAQDIYPELAEQLGVLRPNGFLARLLRWASTTSLRRYDFIVAVGRCMKSRLMGRGLAAEKILIMPNWAQQPLWQPGEGNGEEFRKANGIKDEFVVMYSGNLGLGHPFEAMVQAATLLQEKRPDVLFVFIGDGARLAWLKEQTAKLRNVRFLPFQPLEKLHISLRAADVHIVSQQEFLSGLLVPSKAYGGLAAGRPCIFLGPKDAEVAQLLAEKKCGVTLPANDGMALAQCIHQLLAAPEELQRLRQNTEALVPEVSLTHAVTTFRGILDQLVGGQKQASRSA